VEEDREFSGDGDDGSLLRRTAAGGEAQAPIAKRAWLAEAGKYVLCALHE